MTKKYCTCINFTASVWQQKMNAQAHALNQTIRIYLDYAKAVSK